jgi:uncharacterized protein YpmS
MTIPAKMRKPPTKRAVASAFCLMALNSLISVVILVNILIPRSPNARHIRLEMKVLRSQSRIPKRRELETAILIPSRH